TVQDVLDLINNHNGGMTVQAKFDMVHHRLELTDLTGGKGDFSVESKQNQLFLKDLPAHAAADLGLLKDVGAASTILSTFDSALESEATPLSFLNGGLGVERGFIRITGHDGVATDVNLSAATTVQEVIDAINAQTGGNQTASYDTTTGTFRIDDNTVGTNAFHIDEVNGAAPVTVREPATIAKRLGLLKSSQGNNLLGDSLQPGGLTTASALSSIVPPPEKGIMVLRGADGNPVEVDLARAGTIQDVLSAIDATQKFSATWDVPAQRFIITDVSGEPGSEGISAEERTNTARDLGFLTGAINYQQDTLTGRPISVKNLPTLVGSIDLNPAVSGSTTIDSLNAGRTFNQGAQLGRIRITDKAGHFLAIDLRGSKTIQDVLNKINDPANGIYVEAKINADRNGIEIIDKNRGATGKLEIIDVDSTAAYDLGISTPPGGTVDKRWVGRDIDPAVTDETSISDLRVNEGGIPLGKVYVQSGEYSGEIDLTGARTVKELLDKLSLSDMNANLTAWISEDGKRLNLSNTKGQAYIKVRDIGTEPEQRTASGLGLGGSRGIFETLMDLRDNLLRNDSKAISEVSIKDIQTDITRVLKYHTEVGAKTNRATGAKEKLENFNLNLKKVLSDVEDVDMTEAITRM
ncbi:MAG TPA: flagellin, partial [Candidatus Ozemobacteraceae bacterium]|nr:flagellin [Candidatus Ozemobacteraceae bacterium]